MDVEMLGLPPGTKIGHFTIVRMIGTGGMGAVYEAEHVDLKKRVAIKTLKPEFSKNAEIKERFLSGFKSVHSLNTMGTVGKSSIPFRNVLSSDFLSIIKLPYIPICSCKPE